ncbi:hypothetical protein [Paraclostridium bifermentans]|uniref:hypothetical protein n=1 Tax=Paraclostridium bifermentans TaxID=1490 RepID=UPI00115B9682|nr:hypothetical protein [Paraclostridium bifermentans]TQO56344.1 hypothetical protein D5S05_14155 [Paraclostridium bifermentans]
MNNFSFIYYFFMILFLILTIFILPKRIIDMISKDLNTTEINDDIKKIIVKSRFFFIGFFAITYFIYFKNISIELIIIVGLVTYLLKPKLILNIKDRLKL